MFKYLTRFIILLRTTSNISSNIICSTIELCVYIDCDSRESAFLKIPIHHIDFVNLFCKYFSNFHSRLDTSDKCHFPWGGLMRLQKKEAPCGNRGLYIYRSSALTSSFSCQNICNGDSF